MKRKAASDEFLSAWKDLVSFADENPGVGMMLSEANRLYTFYRWPSRGDQQEAEGARADIVEELDRLIDARSQYEDDAELVALLEATRDAAQDDTLENALEDDPYKSVGTMKRKRQLIQVLVRFDPKGPLGDANDEDGEALDALGSFAEEHGATRVEAEGDDLLATFAERDEADEFIEAVADYDGVRSAAYAKAASRGVTTKGEWSDPVYLALMALAEEHNGIDTGMGYQGATVFQFSDEADAEAFMDAPGIDDLAAGLKGPERNTERGARPWWTVRVLWAEDDEEKTMSRRALVTKSRETAADLLAEVETLIDGASIPREMHESETRFRRLIREVYDGLDDHGGRDVADARRALQSMRDEIDVRFDGEDVYPEEIDELLELAIENLDEEKSMSKLRTKYCDYPSYAGMPFGSPTLSTRYQDVPAAECTELSYSVREAGEALEAASAIYLQRAAAAARGDDDSAPDVAAMNTLNGVAVQLETLADRLLAVGEGSSQYLSTGPGDTQCFYSWPDCLPSCLAAVEGALGSVSGDAEYLEVAAQLTVVRDMLRTLLTEDDTESEETTGLGEMKSYRTKGRLGRLSAVSDKVDYAVDALSGFSRGTDGVADALRILKDMRAAIEDGDRDAFGTALDELGGVRDEVDGDLDEGETGEFPYELAWLLSDLTDAYYGNKSARLETTKGHGMRKSYQTKRRSTMQDIYDGWSDVVDATTGIDAGVVQEIIGKLEVLVDVEPMNVQAVSDAIADAILNAGEYEDAEALVSALERFDNIVATYEDEPLRDGDGNYMGRSYNNMRTKKSSRRSRFGDARNAMDTLGELSTQLDRVTDEAWTGRRRIVDSKARAALETAVAAASFVAESVRESVDTKAPLAADQLADELGRASDALRVLEKSGDPWATTFRDDLSEFGSLLGRSASALDRYLDEKGEESGDEDDSGAGKGKDDSRGSKLRRRQLAETKRSEAEIIRKASRAARLAREVQGLERLLDGADAGAVNDEAFARAVTKPTQALAAKRASRVRAY